MRLLLDSHIFLWLAVNSSKLPNDWYPQLEDPDNDVYLSNVSTWEIALKHSIGKLLLPNNPVPYLTELRDRFGVSDLPLDDRAISQLAALPHVHRDPFDRMIACQAIQHQLKLVTVDPIFEQYPVELLPR